MWLTSRFQFNFEFEELLSDWLAYLLPQFEVWNFWLVRFVFFFIWKFEAYRLLSSSVLEFGSAIHFRLQFEECARVWEVWILRHIFLEMEMCVMFHGIGNMHYVH